MLRLFNGDDDDRNNCTRNGFQCTRRCSNCEQFDDDKYNDDDDDGDRFNFFSFTFFLFPTNNLNDFVVVVDDEESLT